MSSRTLFVLSTLAVALILVACGTPQVAAPANTPVPPTKEVQPTKALPTNTLAPTATEVLPTDTLAPTAEPASSIGLPAGCVDALTVTTDMIGQTLCVGGIVAKQLGSKGDYFIYFSTKDFTKLYFFGPSWKPTITNNGARDGDCVYIQNAKISASGNGGMIVPFIPKDLKHCDK
jgi:hypothetical protein